MQILSAWACHNGITLSQRAVDHKSNEITAVPKLLRHLNLKGAIVSIDAMGTQLKIAIAIIQAGADYLLALKANQGTLHDDVREFFQDPGNLDYAREKGGNVQTIEHPDKGHGRIEKRVCTVTDWLDWLPAKVRRDWLGLRSIVGIESHIALDLLKTATAKPKEPIRGKRICAALDPSYLEAIIGIRQM